ncbi:MAG TPA: PAS domain S-box protein [Acidimicrobiales bacterium]|nr:PAS domain S-box protein [Acidimicrobiales bacterium]
MREPTDIGALLQALPLPMWVYEPDTLRILAVNKAAVDSYGWSAEEFTARTVADLGVHDDSVRIRAEALRDTGTRQRSAAVWRHRQADGSEVDVLVRTSPVTYDGVAARLAIVEAMSTSSRLSEVAARGEAIIGSSSDAIISMDLDGIITVWNPAAERMYGYLESEMLGTSVERIVPAERRGELSRILEQVSEGERLAQIEYELVTSDDSRVLVASTVFPVCDASDRVVGVCAISRDITEQRRSIERDRALSKLNTRALSDAPLSEVIDLAARILHATLQAEVASVFELLPDPPELLLVAGAGWARARIGEMRLPAGPDSLWGRTITATVPAVLDFTFDRGDPNAPALPTEPATRRTVVAPIRVEGSVWGAVAVHFAGHREPRPAERSFVEAVAKAVASTATRAHRQTTRARSEELGRLVAVGQMAAGVCHDFNNVLTVVQLAAERLRTSENLTPTGLAQLELVRSQLDHASTIIWQILDFAREHPYEPKLVDLGQFVEALGGILNAVLGPRITLSLRTGRGPLRVTGDPVRLQQIVMNLVTNAREAMPDGGTLVVVVTRRNASSLAADLPVGLEAGTWVVIEVSDTGVGMSDEVKRRAFEPFFTTRGPGKGTGLGLAQVANLVAQHDGHVGVRSEEGRGTTVSVWLPPALEGAGTDGEAHSSGSAPDLRTDLLRLETGIDAGVPSSAEAIPVEAEPPAAAADVSTPGSGLVAAGSRQHSHKRQQKPNPHGGDQHGGDG